MKKQGDINPSSQQTPASAAEQRMIQLRKNLKEQVAQLKQSVSITQQESLTQFQNEVDLAFGKLTANIANQMRKQDEEINEPIASGNENSNSDAGSTNVSGETEYPEIPIADGRKAIKQANYGALEAMKSAESSVQQGQNLINQLLQHKPKIETPDDKH